MLMNGKFQKYIGHSVCTVKRILAQKFKCLETLNVKGIMRETHVRED